MWAFAITWRPSSVKFSHFNLLLWNCKANWSEFCRKHLWAVLYKDAHFVQIQDKYRGPSIDASYQVSVHLTERFQRRRLKCEKLTNDRLQVMAYCWIYITFFMKYYEITNAPAQCMVNTFRYDITNWYDHQFKYSQYSPSGVLYYLSKFRLKFIEISGGTTHQLVRKDIYLNIQHFA
jgi:hypothetical protein